MNVTYPDFCVSIKVLANICKGSSALEKLCERLENSNCKVVENAVIIGILDYKERYRQSKFCVASVEEKDDDRSLQAFEVIILVDSKMPGIVPDVVVYATGPHQLNTYKKLEEDLKDWGTDKKKIILSNFENYYRYIDRHPRPHQILPICVGVKTGGYIINPELSDFKISHNCECNTPNRENYACDFVNPESSV